MARGKCGNLDKLSTFFEKGIDFTLSQEEYEKITGGILSENKSYIKNQSALSKITREKGYFIEIEPMQITPMKLHFKKYKEIKGE